MYKPGNVSRPPPLIVPHQPRLDWQMWFAALGPHTHSPWFTSLVLRLLQGKEPGEAAQTGGRDLGGAGLREQLSLSPCPCSHPPPPERCGPVPLPQAATHLRAGPALQVLVLAAWGAGVRLGHHTGTGTQALAPPECPVLLQSVVATPVGRGILPTRVPGGPVAGRAAQAVWPSGGKASGWGRTQG